MVGSKKHFMKSILFTLLFLLVPKLAISQTTEYAKFNLSDNDKLIYTDSTQMETKSKDYKFLRIIKDYKLDKESYTILEYYKSGVLHMQGTSKTKDFTSKEGEYIFYYANGNKNAVTNYVKSRPNGKTSQWYENGNKKLEGEYIEDEKTFFGALKIFQFWNPKGVQTVVDGNGECEEISEFFHASGKIKEGFKDGLWQGSDKKMRYTFSENYENQKLISGVSIDSTNVSRNYKEVELRPSPKKGYEDFYRHVGKKFRVPDMPKGMGGKIFLKFIVDKEGRVVEPEIIRGIGYGADEEALRVVSSYTNFAPGEIRGIKVRCSFSLPITIQPMQ